MVPISSHIPLLCPFSPAKGTALLGIKCQLTLPGCQMTMAPGRQAPGGLDEGHGIVSFGVFQSNFLHIRLIEALFPHLTGAVALSERCGLLQVGFACVFRPNDMHPT